MKIFTETYNVVEYFEFDDAVRDFFDKPEYEFVAEEEASNYASYVYDADGEPEGEWEKKRFDEWMAGGYLAPSPRLLLNRMVAAGKIPAGKYLVKVFW